MLDETQKPEPPGLWDGQLLHISCLAALLIGLGLVWIEIGRPFPAAFWIAACMPVVHQAWVWFAWRLELQSSTISKSLGFKGYLIVFFVLFGARFVSLAYLAFLDQGSLNLSSLPRFLVAIVLLSPGLYAMYSVRRYFGMARAAGGDHFEQRFRDMPLVNEGIFRFTSNGMYLYAFLLFWAIAVGFNSLAALIVAAFSHAYIWVHFQATEKPDMEFLYGSREPTKL